MLRAGLRRQLLAIASASLAMVSMGVVLAWSSPAVPKLPHLTAAEASWVGSLPSLAAALGPWLGGWAADRVGRRATALLGAVPMAGSWVALMFVEHAPTWLCVVRFVSGLGIGLIVTSLSMYGAEISQANIRGALLMLQQPSITTGFMLDYCIGPFVSYTTLAAIGLAVPLLFMVTFFWVPESPYYLLARGRDEEAESSLRRLRWDLDKGAVEESKENEASVLDLFRSRRCRRALVISLGLVCAEQLAGINAVLFYSQSIFDAAGGDVDSRVAPIIVNGAMLIESCVTPFLVDRLGRRPMLIFSSTGMSVALTVLAVYFYLSDTGKNVEDIGWLPLTALVFYIITYTSGYGGLTATVPAEIFSQNVKSVALPVATFVSWTMSFLVTRFFEDISSAVGNYGPFFLFAACSLLASFHVYFLLPETKGKTLEEIQVMLESATSDTLILGYRYLLDQCAPALKYDSMFRNSGERGVNIYPRTTPSSSCDSTTTAAM
ncbi:facilitated trehalose transporter Tret1-like [Schistocerca cancellata]|uniref:facilitated trehalose transporter Tret1-like n=1 Tax=Schistocerca cancellata TaxID=274614 RepID=UPI002117E18B|nr:facilitated trehalose transporter Tret1-like [Schistocerca cancellata]